MPDLPKWVYDIVLDLAEQQDVHPKLLFESAAFKGTRQYDWCPCNTLAKVPAEVVERAKVASAYLRAYMADQAKSNESTPTSLERR